MSKEDLIELIKDKQIIATMGICKNAGKTTVLNYIVRELKNKQRLGITSIGYDGEETDVITKLPKPRVLVYPGMLVATTRSCLLKTETEYDLIFDPQMNTSIGQVFIVRIKTQGTIEIAGPSIRSSLETISLKMIELGCDKVILDGAAGRTSFGTIADCCILSIGAALSTSFKQVIKSSQHKIDLLQLISNKEIKEIEEVNDRPYRKIEYLNKEYIVFRGSVVDQDLSELMEINDKNKKLLVVVNDPTTLFISPKILYKFQSRKNIIYVRNSINLEAITINPMSPYGEWFESNEFIDEMSKVTCLPIYDVKTS